MPRKKKWLLKAMLATLKPYAFVGSRAHEITSDLVSWFSSVVPNRNYEHLPAASW